MKKERRVVVTGVGPLASTGIGKDAFWQGILERKTGLTFEEIKLDGETWDKFYLHKIGDFNIERSNIKEDILNDIRAWKKGVDDKDLNYLLAAIKLAIEDSRISYDTENNNIGVFLTIEHPGFENYCEKLVKVTVDYLKKNPFNKGCSQHELFNHVFKQLSQRGYDLQSFMYLYFISRAFGFHGYSLFTNNACASGLFAMESAARQIRYGGSDIVLLAGGDTADTMFKHIWFKEQNLYAEDGKMKPFSKNADGIVLGDGASAMVLEELEHALNRDAHIYAEYLGGGFSMEGWKVTLPKIGSSSYQKAIMDALSQSDLIPEDIDLINPHGVALKATDAYEAKAIADVFGKRVHRPLITALKPYVGHNLGGSAILESIILLLSLEKNIVLPTLNQEKSELNYNIELVNELSRLSFDTVMKLSCGFAGYNAAAVFKKMKN